MSKIIVEVFPNSTVSRVSKKTKSEYQIQTCFLRTEHAPHPDKYDRFCFDDSPPLPPGVYELSVIPNVSQGSLKFREVYTLTSEKLKTI